MVYWAIPVLTAEIISYSDAKTHIQEEHDYVFLKLVLYCLKIF